MKTPHKHAELIKAWADGEKIEYFNTTDNKWEPIFKGWSWDSDLYTVMRIKPEPKPDEVLYACYDLDRTTSIVCTLRTYNVQQVLPSSQKRGQLKLTIDGETGKIKSAEVI